MQDNLEKINNVPFLDIFGKLGIQTEKDTIVNEYKIQVPGENRISNGSYKLNASKNAVFANGSTRPQGSPFLFVKGHLQASDDRVVFKFFEDEFGIKSDMEKKVPNISKKELLENIEKFIIKEFNNKEMGAIKTWLRHRGFSHEYLSSKEGEERIKEVFNNIGFCENPATKTKTKNGNDWLPSRPVLIFPQIDIEGKIVGGKMRKINNLPEDETSKETKSINLSNGKSGLLFKSLSYIKTCQTLIICEGEPDYIVLRMLGFNNVIGNLGGVEANKDFIKELIKFANIVVVAYDNDQPGREGARRLAEKCKRQMFYIKYVDRKGVNGEVYKDINEYFEGGFNYEDFSNMIKNSTEVKISDDGRGEYDNGDSKVELTMMNKNPFIFLRNCFEFYDIYENKIVKQDKVMRWCRYDAKELQEAINSGEIKTYYDVCYWKGGKKNHYNILDEKIILQPAEKAEIHPDIEFLIKNLCGNKKDNIEWLHKAILYKYTHVNDVLIPAVLFKGVGGSGKGTFMKLLTKIFSPENVMSGLGTNSLTSDFCPYTGNKIVVEINELGGGNHKDAVRILDKLKSLVFEPRIMVNMKGVQAREVDNIAWFIMSSNHAKPLKLDGSSSGNRRFSIITTGPCIEREPGKRINETIMNSDYIAQYISWLIATYPEVINMVCFETLENEDKKLLVEQSEHVTEEFFNWFQEKFPHIYKISSNERTTLMELYRSEIGEKGFSYDHKYSVVYFNQNLPHHIQYKKVSIRGKSVKGYYIVKPGGNEYGESGYFQENTYEEQDIGFSDITNKFKNE